MIKFTLLYLVILFLPTGVFASKVSLNELKVYLNNIKTLQAEFEQRINDNSVSYGVLFIKKPNKLRMKYEKPNNGLVLINNQLVTIFDFESNNVTQTFPLAKTPFRFLLSDLSLELTKMDINIYSEGSKTFIKVQNKDETYLGYIKITFNSDPIALEKWVLVNSFAEKVEVKLKNIVLGVELKNNLFNRAHELQKIENNR
ncbi:MAG: outer membrane lipoprotein carrier protein LolA [Rhodobacteraceae bacterium]|nr:outer membrane lipoprotein carrier protein LolA [Paracoccaceae bacterium]